MKRYSLIFILLILSLDAKEVGSDSLVSRQGKTFFENDAGNKMTGFSLFKNGFILADSNTMCEYSAHFPISGDIVFNGGTLKLQNDLTLQSPVNMSAGGLIDGNFFAINLPHNVSTLYFPSQYHDKVLQKIDETSFGKRVFCVDWSYDSKYLAVGLDGASNIDELQIFELVNDALVLRSSENVGSDVRAVAWHPSSYYLATGSISGNELQTWLFDPETPSITEIDNDNTNGIYAISWSKDGAYLAAARYSTYLYVYSVSNGLLGSQIQESFGNNITAYDVDWDSAGNYIAVGLKKGSASELQIFSFNGSSLSLDASGAIGQNVYATRWRPNDSLLALGTSAGSDQLELYSHTSGSVSRIDSALVGETKPVLGLCWCSNGTFLAVAKDADSNGMEVEVFYYDAVNQDFSLVSGYSYGTNADAISWAPSGDYLATSDTNGNLQIFSFTPGMLTLKDTKLLCDSAIIFTTPIAFEGCCVINGNNNTIDLASTASLIIKSNSNLLIQNMVLKGINSTKIQCAAESSSLTLRNVVWTQDGDTQFENGSIIFDNSVKMCGNSIFAYHTNQTSTIRSDALLKLSSSFTFSYDPIIENKSLLEFEDSTAQIILNSATLYTTMTGMQFKKGSIAIQGISHFAAESQRYQTGNKTIFNNNGFTFGDGNAENDCVCTIYNGACLVLESGALRYKNVLPNSWIMENDRSILHMKSWTYLILEQNLNVKPGSIVFEDRSNLQEKSSSLTGSIEQRGFLTRLRK